MKVAEREDARKKQKSPGRKAANIITAIVCIIAVLVVTAGVVLQRVAEHNGGNMAGTAAPGEKTPLTAGVDPSGKWPVGYISSLETQVVYYDVDGNELGTLLRGSEVKFDESETGEICVIVDGTEAFLAKGATVVRDPSAVIPTHTQYVRSAVNLRTSEGRLINTLLAKGTELEITGCDYLEENGEVHMYRVKCGDEEGYVDPWYLEMDYDTACANYDYNGNYATHAKRGNVYGGGSADTLDYYPREKGDFADNIMPSECRTLYIASWKISEVDAYIEIANNSGINAFVVDITDGAAVAYASDVMMEYCPTGAANASNTVEEYRAAIQKIKDAGYYVIGRITTFNDKFFVQDHPESAILGSDGNPLKLAGSYWPSPYDRYTWQYKVDLAVEAVELMGFNEIQFDYVRFPDLVARYENAGTINYNNVHGETKAEAIQRFLMYATDVLHEMGVYVSADVFGESAYSYVTAYGQYWPAISNVVDVISGMPYPDHFAANGDWLPWEHPYETMYNWGGYVMNRQAETATPAIVRTWIQAYNAIKEPYNTYGPDQVADQVAGLRDAGLTGGYMTWNGSSSVEKYTSLIPAFAPPEDE